MASALIRRLAMDGCTEVIASVAQGWPPGTEFLGALGFVPEGSGEAGRANRNRGAGERATVRARLRIGG